MTSTDLDNLVRLGQLHEEKPRDDELGGLRHSGMQRLADAERLDLSYASRFDLAYNAVHALALFALRRMGYRSDKRYIVFQCLPHTAGMDAAEWRVLAKAHQVRNSSEYEGYLREDERLLNDMIAAARRLEGILFGGELG